MDIRITNEGILRLRPGQSQFRFHAAAASVDIDDTGIRDNHFSDMSEDIGDEEFSKVTIDLTAVAIDGDKATVTLTAAQQVKLVRKLLRGSIRSTARKLARMDDAMPEEVPEEPAPVEPEGGTVEA